MHNHIQITFTDLEPEQQDVVIAHLAEIGFDGFEENERELKAFVPETSFDKLLFHDIVYKYQLTCRQETIRAQNWNATWESSFQPVVVDDFAGIRADFHPALQQVKHEIIITPKMSFGTGHHATTYMMVEQLKDIDCRDKTVFDFGTGTGILAILAEKLGAKKVVAVDNDEWSITNAAENLERNNCSKVQLMSADSLPGNEKYHLIMANINKNVILEKLDVLIDHLQRPGILILSGLLITDEPDMLRAAKKTPLVLEKKITRQDWISLRLSH